MSHDILVFGAVLCRLLLLLYDLDVLSFVLWFRPKAPSMLQCCFCFAWNLLISEIVARQKLAQTVFVKIDSDFVCVSYYCLVRILLSICVYFVNFVNRLDLRPGLASGFCIGCVESDVKISVHINFNLN